MLIANPPSINFQQLHSARAARSNAPEMANPTSDNAIDLSEESSDPKLFLLKRLVEGMSGKKINTSKGVASSSGTATGSAFASVSTSQLTYTRSAQGIQFASTSVSASMSMTMSASQEQGSRETSSEFARGTERRSTQRLSLSQGENLKDPLILNFNHDSAQLGSDNFSVDMDNDGVFELIPQVKNGSAYLVFDKDGNGVIDRGAELFGPQTGDGFSELAIYDHDSNGMIDKDDPIYQKLMVLSFDDQGNQVLEKLDDKGVEKIFLESIKTSNSIIENNQLRGVAQKTAAFVDTGGQVHTIQHVDVVVT